MTNIIDVTDPTYGAIPDGTTDNTVSIQNALTAAAACNGYVLFPGVVGVGSTYLTKEFTITAGARGIISTGATLKGNIMAAVINFIYIPGNSTDVVIDGFILDINQKYKRGILIAAGCQRIVVRNCTIRNMDQTTASAIKLLPGCVDCSIINNNLDLPTIADVTKSFVGVDIDSYNDLAGVPPATPPAVPDFNNNQQFYLVQYFYNSGVVTVAGGATRTVIHNNVISNGSHGIMVRKGIHTSIQANRCLSQRDRSIAIYGSINSVVENNQCLFFGSSAVGLFYGCSSNLVSNNYAYSPGATGEAAIQAYLSASSNQILNNYIDSATNYGIYLGCNVFTNVIKGNTVRSYKRAGIMIESDWINSATPGNFSKPNAIGFTDVQNAMNASSPTSFTITKWAFSNSAGNSIIGNSIYETSIAATAAIALTARAGAGGNNFALGSTTVTENQVFSSANDFMFSYYEDNFGKLVTIIMRNNNCPVVPAAKILLQNGRGHFAQCENNSVINDGSFIFASLDATPNVSIGKLFSHSSNVTITNFTFGMDGQEIIVNLTLATSVIQNNANISLRGGTNATGIRYIAFRRILGVWQEMYRSI